MADEAGAAKHPGGRPPEYKPEYAEQAAKLCLLGATDDELADFFGVHRATIYRWKHAHSDFCDAIIAGKEVADERVERALYQKATGYNVTEEMAIKVKLEQFREGVEVVEVDKHIPADTTAAIFWLKNRRSGTWRDKHEHGVTDKEGNDVPLGDLEAARRVAFILSNAARKAE